jgi:hypothetical protein
MAAIPIDLVEAVQKGNVGLKAKPENSFAETRLNIENKTPQQLEIDLSRSGLIPKTGGAQRVGLCYPVGFQPGDYILSMKPGQQGDILVSSRCLDEHRPAPDASMEYELLPDLLPVFIVDALRQGLEQILIWQIISQQGGSWGHDLRPVPQITHQALIGEWEATLPGNMYRLRITWNDKKGRYEGILTHNGEASAYVGFAVGEFTYEATPTSDVSILEEQGMWRFGANGVSTSSEWRPSILNLGDWKSWNDGVFNGGVRHKRVG